MRFQLPMPVRRRLFAPVLGTVLVLAACGGSGHPASSATQSSSPSPSSAASTMSPLAAKSEIKSNWATFFDGKTPVPKRVALLQNGQVFAPVIRAQAGSPLATAATAKVTKVTLVSASEANVVYTILVGGKPALSNQHGIAVFEDGTWKVGDASFCGLLTIENNGDTSSLPAACRAGV